MKISVAVVALCVLGHAPVGAAEGPVDKGPLPPGNTQESEIAAGAEHSWTLLPLPGAVHEVRVAQDGSDLEVRWSAGAESRRVNRREGRSGEEVVWWVAGDAAAPTSVTVKPVGARAGRYAITLLAPRPAGAADHERHQAEQRLFGPRAEVEQAARAFATLGLPDRRLLALQRLSELAARQGDPAAARQAAEDCVTIARASGVEDDLAKCLLSLADARKRAADPAGAAAAYAEALALRERAGDPAPIAIVLHDSANLLIAEGEYDRAEAQLLRAAALGREDGNAMVAVGTGMTLGILAGYRGDPEAALSAFEAAREQADVHGRPDHRIIIRVNLGVAYGQVGDFERSVLRLREAIAMAEEQKFKPAIAFGRLALGAKFEDTGQLDEAAAELQAAAALAREMGDRPVEADAESFLGWVRARQGDLAAAVAHAAAAEAAAARSEDRMRIATAALYRGMVMTTARRFEEAGTALRAALAAFEDMGRPDDQARASAALARLAREKGERAAALEHAERALAGFESVRTQVALADRRAQYLSFRREAYDLAVAILLDQGDHARAFQMTERARARSFLEEVRRASGDAFTARPDLTRAHRAALDRLTFLQRQLIARRTAKGERDRAAVAQLEKDLERAVAGEESARRALREAGPAEAAGGAPVTAEAVAARLAPDEALLEYHAGHERSWLFAVTRRGLAVFPLPAAGELRRDVDALRRQLARPSVLGAPAYASIARALHATLFGPALPHLAGVRRLRIVPDGPLWELPFEALVAGSTGGRRYADLSFAIRRWQFVYHPSSSILANPIEPSSRPASGGPALVAFANPRFDAAPRGPALASAERAIFREGDTWSLPPLPCAEREARGAAALFGGSGARVFTGAEARESRVKTDPAVAGARYLLFSTHALLSETLPSQSSLVMALPGDGADDGLLQVHEIDGLRLRSDLVVLSACESALGRNLRGEGMLGLSRAFFHAGARALLATLWKVSDCSTADLTVAFFSGLAARERPDAGAALRQAKLALLKQPATAHPYHWAPFVLVGASGGS